MQSQDLLKYIIELCSMFWYFQFRNVKKALRYYERKLCEQVYEFIKRFQNI